jgi:hypothetical protein
VNRIPGGFAQAITADKNDNSYIAGYVCTPSTCQNSAPITILQVVKYDKSGNTVWTAQLANSPGNSQGNSVAVDAAGNAYVAGLVKYTSGATLLEEWVTVKFSSGGQQLWASYFTNTAGHIGSTPRLVVDLAGNAYVADGNGSVALAPITLIKYDPNGFQLWMANLGSGTTDTGYGFLGGLELDGQGNAFVAASFDRADGIYDSAIVTLAKYDSNGNLLWSKNIAHSAPAILAVDAQGNAYVGSDVGSGTLSTNPSVEQIAKFDPNGNITWTGQYTPPNATGFNETAIGLDGSGNIYITGYILATGGTTPISSYSTVKFEANGNFAWEKRYNGNGNGFDQPNSLLVDPQDNLYVTGYSTRTGAMNGDNDDYATIEYDSQGNQLWVARYSNPADFGDSPAAIALGNSGIFITGTSYAQFDAVAQSQWATIEYVRPSVLTVSQSSVSFSGVVGTSSAAQQISLTNNGNAAITVAANPSISGSNPAFSIVNGTTCAGGTAINPGSSCLISVVFAPSAATNYNATLTIEDGDSGSPQTVNLTGTGTPAPSPTPDFSLAAATNSIVVTAGQKATFIMQIVPTSFGGTVTLACGGAPAASACTVSPSSVAVTGNSAVQVMVNVATTGRSRLLPMGIHFNRRPRLWIPIILVALSSLLGLSQLSGGRLRPSLGLAVVLLTACMGCSMAATGTSENRSTPPNVSTPTGTSTLTVTATSGATVRTLSLTLTVN